jgi:ABC-type Zn uptake system ZnuABC Zn-binding protein ZnuA
MEISMVKKTTLGVDEKSPASKNKSKGELTQYIDVTQQEAMIAKAAYFKAMQRDFVAGHEMDDWLAAEADIYGLVY